MQRQRGISILSVGLDVWPHLVEFDRVLGVCRRVGVLQVLVEHLVQRAALIDWGELGVQLRVARVDRVEVEGGCSGERVEHSCG